MPDFVWLADAIRCWPDLPALGSSSWAAGCQRRLWDALALHAQVPDRVGPGDLATLVRHVLRREQMLHGSRLALEVPASSPWPTNTQWEDAGCEVTEFTKDRRLVAARPWQPEWLPGASDQTPEGAAFGEVLRRRSASVPGDGFLSVVGFDHYSGPGQRQAMRAVLASQPGATILVNLPSGTGKSAVAHVPAFLWSVPVGLTVVVVPTTALALDQERAVLSYPALAEAALGRLAYYDQLPRDDREAIRAAIRAGSQRIVFTSPESLVGSLAPAVFHAAQSGSLRLLVIDEAHIVSQWGAEFRPEFQAVAGMRRALLRVCRDSGAETFRTVLATATLTEDALVTLETLFGDPGPFEHISAVTLRPEPSYWIARCADEEERRRRLLAAVSNLPRPLVLYVGTTAQIAEYAALLDRHGFRRLATVLGVTSAEDRLRVIRDWRGSSTDASGVPRTFVDIVVATSAFGLGVDQGDVRTVVHACIPETIDRFYQEVGRGGRDGLACVSVLLWTEGDRGVARGLNQRRIIGTQKGFGRWAVMLGGREVIDAVRNVFRVALDARPPHVTSESNENRAWNLRTLALMSRAGLVELDAEAPPTRAPDESEETWDARCTAAFSRYRNASVIRLLDLRAGDESVWDARCENARQRTSAFDELQLQAMYDLLAGEPAVCEVLQRAYKIHWERADHGVDVGVSPQRSCGGCPACRRREHEPWEGAAPSPPPLRRPLVHTTSQLREVMAGAGTLWVFVPSSWDTGTWTRNVVRLVERAVRHGVRNIIAQPELLAENAVRGCFRHAQGRFVFLHGFDDGLTVPGLPTVWLQPSAPRIRLPRDVLGRGTPDRPWIIVASDQALDPEHASALASQLRTPQLPMTKLLERL